MQPFNGLRTRLFSELMQASGILFLASVFANVCNLLFWLFMVRRLDTVEYGILNALFSLFMILSLPATTIQTVTAKSIANFSALKEFGRIKCFLLHFGNRIVAFGVLFLLIFVLFAPALGKFLKIHQLSLIVVTGFLLFFSIIYPLLLGVLQGAQRFLAMAINYVFNAGFKLILGVILVIAGFKVMGALLGVGLAVSMALALALFQLPKEFLSVKQAHIKELGSPAIYKYAVPVFLSLLGWMILTNADVVLVKHFFSPEEAGFYSVAQMVGKVILFLPAVIGIVLFPKMSEAFSQQRPALPLLRKGLAITGFLCITASIFCGLFPTFVLKVLTRKEALEAVRLVPLFCVAMTFYALVNQFVYYNLAVHRFRYTLYLLLAGALQLGLISLFHPHLSAVVSFLIFISVLLFSAGCLEAVKN